MPTRSGSAAPLPLPNSRLQDMTKGFLAKLRRVLAGENGMGEDRKQEDSSTQVPSDESQSGSSLAVAEDTADCGSGCTSLRAGVGVRNR